MNSLVCQLRKAQIVREQKTGLGKRIPQRQSIGTTSEQERIQQQPVSRNYTGQYAAIHPEDEDDLEEDEEYYVTRPHTSARRYDVVPEQVIRQGNKTFHVHTGAPPHQHSALPPQRHYFEKEEQSSRHVHWLVYLGLFFMAVVVFSFALLSFGNWWQQKQDDWQYGRDPRTFQINAVVGHNDSTNNPSHFIGLNLNGKIVVIELPGGDSSKARSYNVTIIQNNDGNPPVKISFQDINGDGKLDMLVTIGDPGASFTDVLFNNGTQFVSKL